MELEPSAAVGLSLRGGDGSEVTAGGNSGRGQRRCWYRRSPAGRRLLDALDADGAGAAGAEWAGPPPRRALPGYQQRLRGAVNRGDTGDRGDTERG